MAGEKPYFSIIIPVYNRPDEVRELLESLVGQTCKDFELLLVEDGRRAVATKWPENIPTV